MKQLLVKIDDGLMNRLNELPNKSETVREAIVAYLDKLGSPEAEISTGLSEDRVREIIKEELSKREPVTSRFVPRPPDPDTGYPCCNKSTPCKHWAWDNVESLWKNTITNKTREP